jgi:hypothetical protein
VDDDLLQPSLAGRREDAGGAQPFRLGSQVYPAFFGGALALGAVALWNSSCLGQPRRARVAIAAIVLAAEAALIAVTAAFLDESSRFASIGAGLVAYGGAYLVQRSADRVYHYHARDEEPYASLLGPGILVVVVARLVETPILYAVMRG